MDGITYQAPFCGSCGSDDGRTLRIVTGRVLCDDCRARLLLWSAGLSDASAAIALMTCRDMAKATGEAVDTVAEVMAQALNATSQYDGTPTVAEMGGTFSGPDSVEWLREQRGEPQQNDGQEGEDG